MSFRNTTPPQPVVRRLSYGDQTFLDARCPCGLFASSGGNKYLVAWDSGVSFAVVLEHSDYPEYTCIDLGRDALDTGRWLGPCTIRFTHVADESSCEENAGLIALGDRYACILARSGQGGTVWLPLGWVGKSGARFRDFDGWVVETMDDGVCFFAKSADVTLGRVMLTRPYGR